ncbi:MAG TPA: hypothetical protein VGK67_25060 [Myxococcales bacterium]|jgi:hypothetical protein
MWPVLLAVLLSTAPTKPGSGAEPLMTKVVARNVSPSVPRDSFAAQPKTFYRSGTRYGRVEEAPDREHGIHGLFVVDEPKAWMINLATKTGRTIVDPGPTFVFHAPIILRNKGEKAPPLLEFGLEPEFLKEHAATASKVTVGKREHAALTATVEGYRVTLLTDPSSKTPRRITVEREGKVVCEYEYLEHRRDLPLQPELFSPPEGIALSEAR